jgi:hypothetical protein
MLRQFVKVQVADLGAIIFFCQGDVLFDNPARKSPNGNALGGGSGIPESSVFIPTGAPTIGDQHVVPCRNADRSTNTTAGFTWDNAPRCEGRLHSAPTVIVPTTSKRCVKSE